MSNDHHPAIQKVLNSNGYRKKLKKMINAAKTLRGITSGKIPSRASLSRNLKGLTGKELQAATKNNEYAVDLECIKYWAYPMDNLSTRKDTPTPPKDSQDKTA